MARNLKGHAPREAVYPKYDSCPVARTVTTHVMDAYSTSLSLRQPPYPSAQQQPTRLAISCAPTFARLFLQERDGRSYTAAAHIERGFAAILLVTIGVTNTEVTSNSNVDDGAAGHGLDCTWLTTRHAPVIASLPSPDSGSRGAGSVSQRSLHPPTGNGAQEARS
jgi:hypothetical protein